MNPRVVLRSAAGGVMSALAAGSAFAQSTDIRPDRWHRGWGMEHMLSGSLTMLLFWGAALLLAVVLAVRWLSASTHRQRPSSAIAILEERFARGEIDRAEFEERRRSLSN